MFLQFDKLARGRPKMTGGKSQDLGTAALLTKFGQSFSWFCIAIGSRCLLQYSALALTLWPEFPNVLNLKIPPSFSTKKSKERKPNFESCGSRPWGSGPPSWAGSGIRYASTHHVRAGEWRCPGLINHFRSRVGPWPGQFKVEPARSDSST